MGKNCWFKHYNTASEGSTLRTLWDNGDYEAYGLWWKFHELLSRFESPTERGKMVISWSVLARETGWKPTKCRRVLARICSVSKIEMKEKPDGNVEFLSPNWLELQETRGKKKKQKKEKDPGEVRGENKELRGRDREAHHHNDFSTFLANLPIITQETWIKTYGREFVERQGALAFGYYAGEVASRSWSTLKWVSKIGSSLARDFEYQKNQVKQVSGEWSPYSGLARD